MNMCLSDDDRERSRSRSSPVKIGLLLSVFTLTAASQVRVYVHGLVFTSRNEFVFLFKKRNYEKMIYNSIIDFILIGRP
jgi:hypothetical protein